MTLAPVFISHGGPDVLINQSPARHVWHDYAARLERPRGILIMSAHHLATMPVIGNSPRWKAVHDFGGFPRELYQLGYTPQGSQALVTRAAALLQTAGIDCAIGDSDGLDHGVWVPLLAMYPDADIPVVTLATLPRQDAAAHFRLGQALATLADEGVLIIGSGSITHNLYALGGPEMPPQPWAQAFADWFALRLQQGDQAALLDWKQQAPFARENHPTDEHLLPLFFALGAAAGKHGRSLHRGIEYAAITMDAWVFDGAATAG